MYIYIILVVTFFFLLTQKETFSNFRKHFINGLSQLVTLFCYSEGEWTHLCLSDGAFCNWHGPCPGCFCKPCGIMVVKLHRCHVWLGLEIGGTVCWRLQVRRECFPELQLSASSCSKLTGAAGVLVMLWTCGFLINILFTAMLVACWREEPRG